MSISDYHHEIMTKDREGILSLIAESGSITLLPPEKRGTYLVGTVANERAVCLAWGDELEGRVTMERMEAAYDEVAHAGLALPFLFFGRTSLVVSPDLFAFLQIPWCFVCDEDSLEAILAESEANDPPHVARRTLCED